MSKYSIDGSNTFFLSIVICPFVGLSNPEIISINVVFPSPDLPKIQILSFLFISKSKFEKIFFLLSLYLKQIPFNVIV